MVNMAVLFSHEHMVHMGGLLGNVVAFFVYLAPLPIFIRIYKAKCTQKFSAIPYSVALFSAMLTLYYGLIKHTHGLYLVTINSFGVFVESIYLAFFLYYACRQTRIRVAKIIVLFNFALLGVIIFFTLLFIHDEVLKEKVVGWFCAIFAVCVFASPLTILGQVIRTKSVRFLPVGLSLFLTLSALIWFIYGFLCHDYFIFVPNVLGLLLGFLQMALYLKYRGNSKRKVIVPREDSVPTDLQLHVVVDTTISKTNSSPKHGKEDGNKGQDKHPLESVTEMPVVDDQVIDIVLLNSPAHVSSDATQKELISPTKEEGRDAIKRAENNLAPNSKDRVVTSATKPDPTEYMV